MSLLVKKKKKKRQGEKTTVPRLAALDADQQWGVQLTGPAWVDRRPEWTGVMGSLALPCV